MLTKIELFPHQKLIAERGLEILQERHIAYLAMEMQTGKTLTALSIAQAYGSTKVLFLTKKKAIASIQSQADALGGGYELLVTNDAQMHNIDPEGYDLVIHDEHHQFSAFPKPGLAIRTFKEKFSHLPMLFLSGTPTPEGFSQIYHQFWVSDNTPFPEKSFYAWAKKYVQVTQRRLAHGLVNDYSNANWEAIKPIIAPYMIDLTQSQAGIEMKIVDHIVQIPSNPASRRLIEGLMHDGVVRGQSGTVSADNPGALQNKIHQCSGGTLILDPEIEDGPKTTVVFDLTKAKYIGERWPTEKLVIFYCFAGELQAISEVLGDRVTTDINEFKADANKSIVLQIVSGREGINLKEAHAIVFYNTPFSATSYQQGRARMTARDREVSDVYWLFSSHGIEAKVFAALSRKKNFTLAHFKALLKAPRTMRAVA